VKAIVINTIPEKSFHPVFTSYYLRVIFAIIFLLWCAGNVYSLLAANNANHFVSAFLNHTYSIVCHQAEHKLIYIDGSSTYLCARCTGIYIGALVMSVSLMINNFRTNNSLKSLIISSSIILLDVVFVNTGLYNYSKWIAFTSGFLFGAVIYIYILRVFIEFLQSIIPKRNYE
jgi:uncharacterized membrane protein